MGLRGVNVQSRSTGQENDRAEREGQVARGGSLGVPPGGVAEKARWESHREATRLCFPGGLTSFFGGHYPDGLTKVPIFPYAE